MTATPSPRLAAAELLPHARAAKGRFSRLRHFVHRDHVAVLGVLLTVIGGLFWYVTREDDRAADMMHAIGGLQRQQAELVGRLDRGENDLHAWENGMTQWRDQLGATVTAVVTDERNLRRELHR